MLTALTGTPGTGKTTLCSILERCGYRVVMLSDLIDEMALYESIEEDGTRVIDEEVLRKALECLRGEDMVLEGHLSYLAPADLVVVLRLHPDALRERLAVRGYPEDKTGDNVEAEALGAILVRAVMERDHRGKETPVVELDVTPMDPEAAARKVRMFIRAASRESLNELSEYYPGHVDWTGVIAEWY